MTRTADPAATLASLNAPESAPLPKRFTVEQGRVPYRRFTQSGRTRARRAYMLTAMCEIETCPATGGGPLVLDHCHRHGWIRAALCNAHNVRIAHLEAAWLDHGVDLSATPYWPILMSCEDCRDGRPATKGVPDLPGPKYEQVAEDIREQIRAGVLKPGDRLPSTSALKAAGWKHGTIGIAMRALRQEGWTRGQPGEAVYVADQPPSAPPTGGTSET